MNKENIKDGSRHGKIIVYSDGGARGNPGPAGAGGQILNVNGEVLAEISEYLGETTNNIAEYTALILTLEKSQTFRAEEIEIRADSELMVKQLNGEYKVKNEGLKPLHAKVKGLMAPYKRVNIKHIYRSENKRADELANQAMDIYKEIKDDEDYIADSAHESNHEQGTLF
ncbi:MAG: ribonuclease HI family protein [Rubrobacteridae bacterium]|nr:ribonuclease HI family protein [Rubrobacteridae bacterium]